MTVSYDGFAVGNKPGYHRYSAEPLTTVPRVDQLDLTAAIGQRQGTFMWKLINGVTGQNLGEIQPIEDQPAQITFDSSRTIKRDLRLMIDAVDLAQINTLTDRILPYMLVAGQAWQIGRFMFAGATEAVRSGGNDGSMMLMDEMNLVDQEIPQGFASSASCDVAMRQAVTGLHLPQGINFEASPYQALGGWRIGARRGSILSTLAAIGDLESPWMDNTGVLTSIRTVDPAISVPDLSFDDGYPVISDSISKTTDLLDAPNRFVVIGNGTASGTAEIVGTYDLPPSAAHSAAARGFVIQKTVNLQVASVSQATAAARTLGMRSLPVEQVELATPPDPRHDGFQVIRWDGENWLEIGWSMTCIEGGDMTHTLRRAYA